MIYLKCGLAKVLSYQEVLYRFGERVLVRWFCFTRSLSVGGGLAGSGAV
jgi:hypothetical protein